MNPISSKYAFNLVRNAGTLREDQRVPVTEQVALYKALSVDRNVEACIVRYPMADGSVLVIRGPRDSATRELYVYDYDDADSLREYAEWLGDALPSERSYINDRLSDLVSEHVVGV